MQVAQSEPPRPSTAQAVVESSTTNQFVTFICGDRAFGIDIMSVREIRSWSPTTELPGQPHAAKGVLDIRGSVVQVYDLATLLGAGRGHGEAPAAQVVLVVSLHSQDVGIVVDSVSDIIFARPDNMRPVPPNGGNSGDGIVSTLVKDEDRLIAVLNLAALFPEQSARQE